MNRDAVKLLILYCFAMLTCAGCCRSGDEVWDDTKSAGRHMGRGLRSLGGKHGDSREVCCREEFLRCRDDTCYGQATFDFEPLPDQEYPREVGADARMWRAPMQEPGGPGGSIPGIDGFRDPKKDPAVSGIFQNLSFPYNSCMIKGSENLQTVRSISGYLRTHPGTYLFVEGHCDERGAEAYNLALGARRSNAVRTMLVNEGVPPETIFTVSYGKERPIDRGHTEEAWAKNRRAEFKIYQR